MANTNLFVTITPLARTVSRAPGQLIYSNDFPDGINGDISFDVSNWPAPNRGSLMRFDIGK
jgi:hypothetical protein